MRDRDYVVKCIPLSINMVAQLHMNSLIFFHLDDIKSLTRFQAGPSTINHALFNPSDASETVDGVGATLSSEPYIPEALIPNLTLEGLIGDHSNVVTTGPSTTNDTDLL